MNIHEAIAQFIIDEVLFRSAEKIDPDESLIESGVLDSLALLRLRPPIEEVLEHMCERLGIHPGETTEDGKLTLEFGECLGACEYAPCMLAGETLHRCVTEQQLDEFLANVKTS